MNEIETAIKVYCDKRHVEIPVKDDDINLFVQRMIDVGIINQKEINDAKKACKTQRKV